jgi:TonB family protein
MTVISMLAESALKASLLVGAALAGLAMLPRASAALRHWILAATILGALLVPLLQQVVPAWSVPPAVAFDPGVGGPPAVQYAGSNADTAATVAIQLPVGPDASAGSPAGSTTLEAVLFRVWLIGMGIATLTLATGLLRLSWLASRSMRIDNGRWPEIAREIAESYEIGRPVRLLRSAHPTTLFTWGAVRPTVIIPSGALDWPADRVRVVLSHELAHVQRGDWLAQVAAEVLRSIYWFNPLAWLASARLRQESERACDDVVLRAGVVGVEYADHLVHLARTLNANRGTWYPAPAMARPSSLQRRIAAMLNGRLNRTPISRRTKWTMVLALLTLASTVAGFAAQTFAAFSGTVVDQTGGLVPKVSLVLTHIPSNSKQTVESDAAGAFEFVGLRSGEYALEVEAMGFSPIRDGLTLSPGQTIHRNLTLQIGSLQETITLVHRDDASASTDTGRAADSLASERRQLDARKRAETARNAPCAPSSVGGRIKPPMKIADVRPRYPDNLRGTGVAGLVTLQARIGPDGTVPDVQVVNTVHPDLAGAAIEAVRQWEFTPTLLNCVPVDVNMRVTLTFRVEP